MARDFHVLIRLHRDSHGLSENNIASVDIKYMPPDLPGGRSKAMHDDMATKNTTYNWVCKPHTIYIQYDPNVHLSKVRVTLPKANKGRPTCLMYFLG
jgi:hypothetical protein